MKNYTINPKLRERKDHFVITIYKKDRQNLNVSIGSIIILRLGKYELIRPVRKDFHISLPKNILKDKTNNNKVKLSILKIAKKENCLKRPINIIKNNRLDIRYFIPKKTIFGYPIYVVERNKNYSSIWYPVGGGVRHINIKNFVDIDKIAIA